MQRKFLARLFILTVPIFDIPQRQREPDIEHHGKSDDLWTGFEIPEGRAFGHVAEVNFQHAVGQGG